jgi:hypothetical protein
MNVALCPAGNKLNKHIYYVYKFSSLLSVDLNTDKINF